MTVHENPLPRCLGSLFSLPFLAAATLVQLGLACDDGLGGAVADMRPAAAAPGVDITVTTSTRGDALAADLALLRDGLVGVAVEPQLAQRVHDLAAANAANGGDFEVSFAQLANEAADLGFDLDGLLAQGVLARGGTDADAAHAAALADGFEHDDQLVMPMIFVPTMDADYFSNGGWDGAPPAYLATDLAVIGDAVEVVDIGGNAQVVTGDALAASAAWIVSYHKGDLISAERFWARCDCVRVDIHANECRRGGSPSGHGFCGRTGLFGNDCNQTSGCDGAISDK